MMLLRSHCIEECKAWPISFTTIVFSEISEFLKRQLLMQSWECLSRPVWWIGFPFPSNSLREHFWCIKSSPHQSNQITVDGFVSRRRNYSWREAHNKIGIIFIAVIRFFSNLESGQDCRFMFCITSDEYWLYRLQLYSSIF